MACVSVIADARAHARMAASENTSITGEHGHDRRHSNCSSVHSIPARTCGSAAGGRLCRTDAGWLGLVSEVESLGSQSVSQSAYRTADAAFDLTTALGFVAGSVVTGLGLYLLLASFFQYRYYRKQRETSDSWKCQPQRFPTPRMWNIDL